MNYNDFKRKILEATLSRADAISILGLDANSFTPDDVKRSYKKMSSIHHPDKGGDVEMMKKVNVAYELLKNASGTGTSSSSNYDWEAIHTKYKNLFKFVDSDLKMKFKPQIFVDYFSKKFNQPFTSTIKWNDGETKPSPSYAGFTAEFKNADGTIAFDLVLSVFLANLAKVNTTLTSNPDLSYDMTIISSGYANRKKQKMAQRDWSSKNDHSILSTPEKIFPEAKMKKITGETGATKMTRAGFEKAIDKELGARRWNSDVYIFPVKDGHCMIMRSVMMRQGLWTIQSLGNPEKYRFIATHHVWKSFPEDSSTLETFIRFKDMTMDQIKSEIK